MFNCSRGSLALLFGPDFAIPRLSRYADVMTVERGQKRQASIASAAAAVIARANPATTAAANSLVRKNGFVSDVYPSRGGAAHRVRQAPPAGALGNPSLAVAIVASL